MLGTWGQSDALLDAVRQYNDLRKQGRYSDAEPFARRALELAEAKYGSQHRNTATLLNALANLYRDLGRYAEAEPLYKLNLAITEKTVGSDHPDVANTLGNLAELYRQQDRYTEAEPLYKPPRRSRCAACP